MKNFIKEKFLLLILGLISAPLLSATALYSDGENDTYSTTGSGGGSSSSSSTNSSTYETNVVNLTCESWEYRTQTCLLALGVSSVSLDVQLSGSSCNGKWSFTEFSVQVTDGCRARFSVNYAQPVIVKDILCESWNYNQQTCHHSVNNARAWIKYRHSDRSCRDGALSEPGGFWRHINDGSAIRVDNGCRATFTVSEIPVSNNDDTNDNDNGNDNTVLPNLNIDRVAITVDGYTYDTDFGDVPVLEFGKQHFFEVYVNNTEPGVANTSPYNILVSDDPSAFPFGNGNLSYFYKSENSGGVSANSTNIDNFSDYIYEWISTLPLAEFTTYYMFFDVDPDNTVTETNENDNLAIIEFQWANSSGRLGLSLSSTKQIVVPYDYVVNAPTSLKIYSFQLEDENMLEQNRIGTIPVVVEPIFSTYIMSSDEEVNLKWLPTGAYSVYINDEYERSFKKKLTQDEPQLLINSK